MGAKQPELAESGMARSETHKLQRLLLGVRELGLTAKASCQEAARHLHRVKFDVASYTNDRRAIVEFSKKVAGRDGEASGQEEGDVGHSCFNHD